MQTEKTITIAITDDHVVVRTGLAGLIHSLGNYKVIIEASDGEELLTLLRESDTLPDIAILDINLPKLNGYETALALKLEFPTINVIALNCTRSRIR